LLSGRRKKKWKKIKKYAGNKLRGESLDKEDWAPDKHPRPGYPSMSQKP